MNLNLAFWKKVGVAAALGFLAAFVPLLPPIIDKLDELATGQIDPSIVLTLVVSAIAAGLAGAGRGLLALFSDFLPEDAQHGTTYRERQKYSRENVQKAIVEKSIVPDTPRPRTPPPKKPSTTARKRKR